jgi:hypothetical protein
LLRSDGHGATLFDANNGSIVENIRDLRAQLRREANTSAGEGQEDLRKENSGRLASTEARHRTASTHLSAFNRRRAEFNQIKLGFKEMEKCHPLAAYLTEDSKYIPVKHTDSS